MERQQSTSVQTPTSLSTTPYFFAQPYQVLTALGNPIDTTRATIKIASNATSCAVAGNIVQTTGTTIQNIQIDGNRVEFGSGGSYALMEVWSLHPLFSK